MALFRCNKCAYLQEHADVQVGETIACPRCGNSAPIYNTLLFVGKLLEKYFDVQREIIRLKASASENAPFAAAPLPAPHLIDLSDTDRFTSELQHRPIIDWFGHRQIRVQANLRGVDTTGFFDEVAMSIGRNLPVLKEVVERIRWAQLKEYSSTTIQFDKKSQEDIKAIMTFCQQLHDFSFIARYIPNRQKNNVLLVLQTAPAICQFFSGEWLEWFVLMTCLEYATQRKKRFSCARRLTLTLTNNDSFELDVFMLIDDKLALCIECKSGEFRQDIDKYLTIRKRLGLNGRNFVICVAGLSDEHAKGLTAMYDLSFVNERELFTHLTSLF